MIYTETVKRIYDEHHVRVLWTERKHLAMRKAALAARPWWWWLNYPQAALIMDEASIDAEQRWLTENPRP